jgi:hypothetical protein
MIVSKEKEAVIKVLTAIIKSWIKAGVHPVKIAAALKNTFDRGKIFDKNDFVYSQEALDKIFDGLEEFGTGCAMVK